MQQSNGKIAIRQARRLSDVVILFVTYIVFFIISTIYLIVSYFRSEEYAKSYNEPANIIAGLLETTVGGAIIFFAILAFGMFMVRMQRQTVLGNALQVEYSDYAWLRNWVNTVAKDLAMPRVEVFVTQDPVMNAYALGFAKPYIIVLNSGIIRYMTQEEIKVIVVHEMAHIKYKHTNANVYLTPFLALPIINIVGQWIAGFWQRRTEFTADRLALAYIKNPELIKRALIKVHVGPDVASAMNDIARQWLQHNAGRPMNRLAQTFSNHPFLVRRLRQLDIWSERLGIVTAPKTSVAPDATR